MHSPWWVNHLDNITTVQFQHRLLAITLVILAFSLAGWVTVKKQGVPPRARRAALVLAVLAAGQMALGVATLLMVVPVEMGVLHQLGALVVFLGDCDAGAIAEKLASGAGISGFPNCFCQLRSQ